MANWRDREYNERLRRELKMLTRFGIHHVPRVRTGGRRYRLALEGTRDVSRLKHAGILGWTPNPRRRLPPRDRWGRFRKRRRR